jgi:hypothetical protein
LKLPQPHEQLPGQQQLKGCQHIEIQNTHLKFKTHIWNSKHTFEIQNTHLVFKIHIWFSNHTFSFRITHLVFKTHI